MAAGEQQRHALYEAFRESHGEEVAVNLLEALPPAGLPDLATKDDIALVRRDLQALEEKTALRFEQIDQRFAQIDERFEAFQRQIDQRFAHVDERFDDSRTRIDRRLEALQRNVDEQFKTQRADLGRMLEEQFARRTNRLIAGFVGSAAAFGAVLGAVVQLS